jgi:hypothetical protein
MSTPIKVPSVASELPSTVKPSVLLSVAVAFGKLKRARTSSCMLDAATS